MRLNFDLKSSTNSNNQKNNHIIPKSKRQLPNYQASICNNTLETLQDSGILNITNGIIVCTKNENNPYDFSCSTAKGSVQGLQNIGCSDLPSISTSTITKTNTPITLEYNTASQFPTSFPTNPSDLSSLLYSLTATSSHTNILPSTTNYDNAGHINSINKYSMAIPLLMCLSKMF